MMENDPTDPGGDDVTGGGVSRRRLLRGAGAGLGLAAVPTPTFARSAGPAPVDLPAEPVGVHVAYGGDPSSEVSVGWSGAPGLDARVEYGPTGGSLDRTARAVALPAPGRGVAAYAADLTGLEPATRYDYRAVLDGAASDTYTVRTGPEPGEGGFGVTMWADHGVADPDNDLQRDPADRPDRNVALASGLDADLHLNVGDVSYADGYPSTWDLYFDRFESLFAERPTMTVPGNHEIEPGQGFAQYDARLDALLPSGSSDGDPDRWYTFQYGNVRFVGLNTAFDICPYIARGGELDPRFEWSRCPTPYSRAYHTRQTRFLERTLSAADADSTVDWIVVYHHSGLWTDGQHEARKNLRATWGPLYDRYDVALQLNGHNHGYERSLPMREHGVAPTGTTFLTHGAGGISHYGYRHDAAPAWTAVRNNDRYGTVQLRVTDERLRVRYLALDGTTLDEFDIVKRNGKPTQAGHTMPMLRGARHLDRRVYRSGEVVRVGVAAEAATPVRIRDRVPADWEVLPRTDVSTEPAGDDQFVHFPGRDDHRSAVYFARLPEPVEGYSYDALGPVTARRGGDWTPVAGTRGTVTVAGDGVDDVRALADGLADEFDDAV